MSKHMIGTKEFCLKRSKDTCPFKRCGIFSHQPANHKKFHFSFLVTSFFEKKNIFIKISVLQVSKNVLTIDLPALIIHLFLLN